MSFIDVVRSVKIEETARGKQVGGIFDLPSSQESVKRWHIEYDLGRPWSVGLIVGPSGAGKSSIAKDIFQDDLVEGWDWPATKPVVDGFPDNMDIQEITMLLSSVGFSSPPSWLKPFHVLSNGEKFRAELARTLAEKPEMGVVDEFTSVIDRKVAKIGSAAIQKTVRRRGGQFVAVGCHYDVIDWLDPDWILEPHIEKFRWRSLRGRPKINAKIERCHRDAWGMFHQHHYLTSSINNAARCWVMTIDGEPAAFSSVIPHMGKRGVWRGHRTVCLPDYQGVGIGMKMADWVASIVTATGREYRTSTTAPSLMRARRASPNWEVLHWPKIKDAFRSNIEGAGRDFRGRLIASFRYQGAPFPDAEMAHRIWDLK